MVGTLIPFEDAIYISSRFLFWSLSFSRVPFLNIPQVKMHDNSNSKFYHALPYVYQWKVISSVVLVLDQYQVR